MSTCVNHAKRCRTLAPHEDSLTEARNSDLLYDSSSTRPPSQSDSQIRRHGQYVCNDMMQPLVVADNADRIKELVPAQPVEEEPQERVCISHLCRMRTIASPTKRFQSCYERLLLRRRIADVSATVSRSLRRTVTPRSRAPTPSSEGTTGMLFTAPCALWCVPTTSVTPTRTANSHAEGGQGGQARCGIDDERLRASDEDGFSIPS